MVTKSELKEAIERLSEIALEVLDLANEEGTDEQQATAEQIYALVERLEDNE
jgi:hypothetical protein